MCNHGDMFINIYGSMMTSQLYIWNSIKLNNWENVANLMEFRNCAKCSHLGHTISPSCSSHYVLHAMVHISLFLKSSK